MKNLTTGFLKMSANEPVITVLFNQDNIYKFVQQVLMLYLRGEIVISSRNVDSDSIPKDIFKYINDMENQFVTLISDKLDEIKSCLEAQDTDGYFEIIQEIISNFPNFNNIELDCQTEISDLLDKCIAKMIQ